MKYPYDGSVWATIPNETTEDVDWAVHAARSAFSGWKKTRRTERRNLLYSIADVFDDHADELGELETRQNGKLIREMNGQMLTYVKHEPYGVVVAITPWNSPLLLVVGKLARAIATGNTFGHRPSEHTPVSALRLAETIAEETDLPDGVRTEGFHQAQRVAGRIDVGTVWVNEYWIPPSLAERRLQGQRPRPDARRGELRRVPADEIRVHRSHRRRREPVLVGAENGGHRVQRSSARSAACFPAIRPVARPSENPRW